MSYDRGKKYNGILKKGIGDLQCFQGTFFTRDKLAHRCHHKRKLFRGNNHRNQLVLRSRFPFIFFINDRIMKTQVNASDDAVLVGMCLPIMR